MFQNSSRVFLSEQKKTEKKSYLNSREWVRFVDYFRALFLITDSSECLEKSIRNGTCLVSMFMPTCPLNFASQQLKSSWGKSWIFREMISRYQCKSQLICLSSILFHSEEGFMQEKQQPMSIHFGTDHQQMSIITTSLNSVQPSSLPPDIYFFFSSTSFKIEGGDEVSLPCQ